MMHVRWIIIAPICYAPIIHTLHVRIIARVRHLISTMIAHRAMQARRSNAPLIFCGEAGIPAAGGPLKQWRETFAPQAEGSALNCGHFTPEEDPDGTLAALLPFLTR